MGNYGGLRVPVVNHRVEKKKKGGGGRVGKDSKNK